MSTNNLEGLNSFIEEGKKQGLPGKYEYLVSIVGFSPESSIMFIEMLKSGGRLKKVLFIASPETEAVVDGIVDNTQIKPSQFDKYVVENKTSVKEIFQKIKEYAEKWGAKNVLIDATAGTKPMTAAATMAGAIIGIAVAYADYVKYDPTTRKPIPQRGQRPSMLVNPLLDEIEIERAKNYFNSGRYKLACEIFDKLTRRIEVSPDIKVMKQLAIIYDLLDSFQLDNALKNFGELSCDPYFERSSVPVDKIRNNFEVIREIVENEKEELYPVLFFISAERNRGYGRYDLAVLLYYRCIEEMCSLKLHTHGITPEEMDWGKIDEAVKKNYEEITRKIYGPEATVEFNRKLGLINQSILLCALDDGLFDGVDDLKKLKGIVEMRNSSIYAHGKNSLDKGKADKFCEFAKAKLSKFSGYFNFDLNGYIRSLEFPML